MARTTDAKAGRLLQRVARPLTARQGPGFVQRTVGRAVQYLRDVWTELRRVDWPSRKQLTSSTLIVVVVLVVLALYLGAWDYVFTFAVRWLSRQ